MKDEHGQQNFYMPLLLMRGMWSSMLYRHVGQLLGQRTSSITLWTLLLEGLRAHLPQLLYRKHRRSLAIMRQGNQILSLCLRFGLCRPHWRNLQLRELYRSCLFWRSDRIWRYFETQKLAEWESKERFWIKEWKWARKHIWRV